MRTNITAFLPVIGLCGRLPVLDLGSGSPSQERLSRWNEVPAHAEVRGPDAYKLAVVLLVGAAILSLFS